MANYTQTNWSNGDVITAEKLNKIESGLVKVNNATLFQYNLRETGTVNIDKRLNPNATSYGVLQTYADVNTTDYIYVEYCKYIFISPTGGRFAFYDENKTYLSGGTVGTNGVAINTNLHKITVPTGAIYYRQSATAADGSWDKLLITGNPMLDYLYDGITLVLET